MKRPRVYGLIGNPLSHSFSQDFFKQKFLEESIDDAVYQNFPLESLSELDNVIVKNPLLKGLNVTIPFKKQIIPYLDSLDKIANRTGAVNTIKIIRTGNEYQLSGYNTDVYGFRESIQPLLKDMHNKALVLGTGGAAEAVRYVLKDLGLKACFVSRNPADSDILSYENLGQGTVRSHTILINTTPVGMFPDTNNCPEMDYTGITDQHIAYDLIYNPEKTLFLKKCEERGATIINGRKMLELQAERAWEIWNL